MEIIHKDGSKTWIYWPEQCELCKGYTFLADGKPCKKEKTKAFIKELLDLEHKYKGVYGTLQFKCDYFCVDEEKWEKSKYNECYSQP